MERSVLRTASEVTSWLQLVTKNVVSFDTETTDIRYYNLDIVGMSIYDSQRVCYINLYNNPEREQIILHLQKFFSTLSGLVGHNLSFDLMVLYKLGIPFAHLKLFDTMVAFHLLDEEGEKGLKKLANLYLGVQEPISYEQASSNGMDTDTFFQYAINDAYYTGELFKIFKPQLIEADLQDLMRMEMKFLPLVVEMQINGFVVDLDKALVITGQLRQKVIDLEIEMSQLVGSKYTIAQNLVGGFYVETDTNFNSGKQLAEILYGKLGLECPEFTETGRPATGREALEKLKGKHPFVEKLSLYKKIQKLISAFLDPLPSLTDPDGRVRAKFNVCGTVTGRLSSDSPNLQQLPKENKDIGINVRELFVASPGCTILTCDYSGQELRVLTELTRDETLINSFKQGKDLHLSTAKAVFGIDVPDEALYEKNKEQLDFYKKKFKKERDRAKIVNFGIAYGKGPTGFATDFNISVDEASKIIEAYFQGMPTVKSSIEATKDEVKQVGYVRTMAGRYRRFKKITKDGNEFYTNAMFRQAFNFKIQGYSADMMRMACIGMAKERDLHPEWGLRFLATVHDELVVECLSDMTTVVAKSLYTTFTSAVTFCIPVEAEVGRGNNYGTAK